MDITFGNVAPAAIPTFTPAPRPTASANSTSQSTQNGTPVASSTKQPAGTIPAGSPGAGSPFPTSQGGVTSSTSANGGGGGSGGGGFPLWGVAVLVVGGIAVLGGSVGYAMSRSHKDDEADDPFPPYTPDPE